MNEPQDVMEQAAQVLRSGKPSLGPWWSPELGRLIAFLSQLRPADLPVAPWKLDSWHTITDNEKWLRSLAIDVSHGPAGPRAHAGLPHDLALLERALLDRAGLGLGF